MRTQVEADSVAAVARVAGAAAAAVEVEGVGGERRGDGRRSDRRADDAWQSDNAVQAAGRRCGEDPTQSFTL